MTVSVSGDTPRPEPWLALGAIPLFAGLPVERLAEAWAVSWPQAYRTGETVRREGEPAPDLPLLLRGQVAASSTTAAGQVVRHGAWARPCALDKTAVIDGSGHTATFRAETDAELRALPRAAFLALVDDVAGLRTHVLRTLAAEARRAQERVVAATLPVEARLAAWLLGAADAEGRVVLPASQQQLAEFLGTTRVTLNRALGALRRDGLVELASPGREKAARTATLPRPELLQLRAV